MSNRIAQGQHHLNGRLVDRGKPLQFRLDGRVIDGLDGDTVLSALLASGVTSAGLHAGLPLALDERFAPAIVPAEGGAEDALPMARTPASNGASYRSLGVGAPSRLARFGLKPRIRQGRLPQTYDRMLESAEPWGQAPASAAETVDLVVVGGGVAGLSAALSAGKDGARVVLIERRQSLGGEARLFGAIEGEEAPDVLVERLSAALAQLQNVTVLTRTEALSAAGGTVRAHRVETEGGIRGRMLAFSARRIVLATGCCERLPVFAGNRLPGIVGLAAAFDRADRFGIAFGSSLAINTSVNEGYRLAMLASDAGLSLARMSDTRARPNSRFIEFSKAYGMPLSSALVPVTAELNRAAGPALSLTLASTMPAIEATGMPILADQVVVAGGWQPDLSLWLGAGGAARWAPDGNAIVAAGELSGIALAGSVAGYRSLSGCARSGVAVVAAMFKRRVVSVRDVEIDSFYETPNGATGMAPPTQSAQGKAYLDGGWSLIDRTEAEGQSLAAAPRALGLGDVAAGVQLGLLPQEAAGLVAGERAKPSIALGDAEPVPPLAEEPQDLLPPYMVGRFGKSPGFWSVAVSESRRLRTGALLFSIVDTVNPAAAVGAIVRSSTESEPAIALVAAGHGEPEARLILRDGMQQVAVRLVERRK